MTMPTHIKHTHLFKHTHKANYLYWKLQTKAFRYLHDNTETVVGTSTNIKSIIKQREGVILQANQRAINDSTNSNQLSDSQNNDFHSTSNVNNFHPGAMV